MSRDVDGLEAIAALILDAELARLNVISGELMARKAKLDNLEAGRSAWAELIRSEAGEHSAFIAGRDALWLAWLTRTRARLSVEAAAIAAQREEQRLRAQKAFGRRDALRQMRTRMDAERKSARDHAATD